MKRICNRQVEYCWGESSAGRSGQSLCCFLTSFMVYALFALPVWVSMAQPVAASDISRLIEEALSNNQDLLAEEEKVRALYTEAPFAGSLQDPVVGIGLLNLPVDSFDFDQEAMTQKQLFVSQKFPWFGTLGLKQQASELDAMAADARFQSKRLEVAARLVSAYYDLGFLAKSLELNTNLKSLVTQTLRIAETRYGTGRGLQQDILAGQVKLSELIDEGINLNSREQAVRAEIGSLLNRRTFFDESGPAALDDPVSLPDRELLNRVALEFSPELRARRAALDRTRVQVQLAQKAYMPDFDVRLSYGQREDNPLTGDDRADFFSAVVAMTVPLYKASRQDPKLGAEEQRLAAAEKALLGFKNTLPHSIDRLLAEIKGAWENHSLYRNTLSIQAANLADASLAAYSVSKIEFDTMLAARVRLLQIELGAEKYKYLAYKKLTELEQLIGTSIESLEGVQ